MFFSAVAPRCDSASLRVAHDPVGTEVRPVTGAAVARCLLHDVMVHSVRSDTRRNAACSASKLPAVTAREVEHAMRLCSHASETDPDVTVVAPGISSTPLNTRALCTRMLKRPNGSLQARAVPGSDPVASGSPTGLDCTTLVILLRQHLSLNEQLGGGPTGRQLYSGRPRCQP
jgi:hypothetical protein